jgi:hypothetical protein
MLSISQIIAVVFIVITIVAAAWHVLITIRKMPKQEQETSVKQLRLMLIIGTIFSVIIFGIGSSKHFSGTYESKYGEYSVKFTGSSKCTWYQNGMFFNGTYKKIDGEYHLEIRGSGAYSNTVFIAVKDKRDLIITGGSVYKERFIKQK